ncbi:MAG: hypothetical protein IT294_16030 [Deltaproteobacteria bacterium]|nr:hypothetical protein [Deltaproteobacteria bacterium]
MGDAAPPTKPRADDWGCGWEAHRRRQLTFALAATPADRLRWLEEMMALAHLSGALPRRRSDADPSQRREP